MGKTAIKRYPEIERTYTVDVKHLQNAIIDECRNCVSFTITEGSELVSIHIDMGVASEIDYTIDYRIYNNIKQEIIKAAESRKGIHNEEK